jgi:hypothetical protein
VSKVHNKPIKRTKVGFEIEAKSIPEGSLVWRTGLSGGAPDSVRCTRGLRTELLNLGNFQKPARYNSPDCQVYTGQCPVLQEDAALELGSLGNSKRLLRYNSPDMSGAHLTVRCNCGATATSRQRSPATAINARQSAQASGTPMLAHRTLYRTCPVRHRTSRRAQKSELQRSESNDFGDVAGTPDMSGVHQTVRCTIRQTASTNGHVWWLGL